MSSQMSVVISENFNRQMLNMVQEVAMKSIEKCGEMYGFDAKEAFEILGLSMIKVERKRVGSKYSLEKPKSLKAKKEKPAFPLPFNGVMNEAYCFALRQNNGLYTQCTGERNGSTYCRSCEKNMQKDGLEKPEFGTIQDRLAVGIEEYVDPKGKKPISYAKIMKKHKLTEEQVREEAAKFNMTVADCHFKKEEAQKRGRRPSSNSSSPKVKGTKGRPPKSKKVLILNDEAEDLFEALVADANKLESSSNASSQAVSPSKSEEKEAKKAAEKAEKEAKRAAEKAEKEAKLAAEKAEKEAKKAAEKAEKEAKIAAEKAEKEAKKAAEKAEKEAKKAAEKESKKKTAKVVEVEEEPEQEVLKKIKYQGKKYLLSTKTNLVYDLEKYMESEEQLLLGKWNESTNKIEFNVEDEESEDEYDSE